LGTGSFLLINTGNAIVKSSYGLLTTVLYKSSNSDSTLYALEGAVETAGSAIEWLKNTFNVFEDYEDLNEKYHSVNDNGGLVFVPAFSGLFTPHWDLTARGMIIGLTNSTCKGHIIRATYEAIALRCHEVLRSFEADSGVVTNKVKVDGGLSASDVFLQTLSDVCNVEIVKEKEKETTTLGAAIVAGLHLDVGIWSQGDIDDLVVPDVAFTSSLDINKRTQLINKWSDAVSRCKSWI
jgi:glycerol kinase